MVKMHDKNFEETYQGLINNAWFFRWSVEEFVERSMYYSTGGRCVINNHLHAPGILALIPVIESEDVLSLIGVIMFRRFVYLTTAGFTTNEVAGIKDYCMPYLEKLKRRAERDPMLMVTDYAGVRNYYETINE